MARLRLDFPEKKLATINIPVRITDLNYGAHVGNDAIVSLVHEARVQWLNSLGLSELNVGGASLIMSDLQVEYKGEIFYPDNLTINIFSGEVTSAGFELFFELRNQKDAIVAKAKTGMVCFDYDERKVVAIPEGFKKELS